jgi:hypothetical protein
MSETLVGEKLLDPANDVTAREFSALYTNAILEGVTGKWPEVLD